MPLQPADALGVKLVEVAGGDGEELDPFEQAVARVVRFRQHALVELEPAQLAVQVERRVIEVPFWTAAFGFGSARAEVPSGSLRLGPRHLSAMPLSAPTIHLTPRTVTRPSRAHTGVKSVPEASRCRSSAGFRPSTIWASTPRAHGVQTGLDLRDHAARDRAVGDERPRPRRESDGTRRHSAPRTPSTSVRKTSRRAPIAAAMFPATVSALTFTSWSACSPGTKPIGADDRDDAGARGARRAASGWTATRLANEPEFRGAPSSHSSVRPSAPRKTRRRGARRR